MKRKPKFARRFAVRYHMAGDPSTVLRQGFAATVGGAVRSSVYRVFMREYGQDSYAIIHDRELEVDLLEVFRNSNGVAATFTKQALRLAGESQPKLRRVK